jgi:hypothetical protein
MTDESKIFWADELWAPPSALQSVEDGHIVGTYLSRRFIEGKYTIPLYTAPQQRTWVGLTSEDYNEIFEKARTGEHAVQLAEAKLKDKNP